MDLDAIVARLAGGGLQAALETAPAALRPMDLACSGIKCTLAFRHNLGG